MATVVEGYFEWDDDKAASYAAKHVARSEGRTPPRRTMIATSWPADEGLSRRRARRRDEA